MRTGFSALAISALSAVLFFAVPGAGSGEEKPLLFTNEDIEKYSRPADGKPTEQRKADPQQKAVDSEKQQKRSKASEKQEQEYWCRRGTLARKKIEKADRELREREKDMQLAQSGNSSSGKKKSDLEKKLRRAVDGRADAEGDLVDLEHEAHRKGIRPGWLRCQFE